MVNVRRNALSIAVVTAAAVIPAGFLAAGASASRRAPQAATISEIATPGVESFYISAGPGKTGVWYTAAGTGSLTEVGQVAAGSDTPASYQKNIIQAGQQGEAGLGPITQGPDQNLWFVQSAEPSSAGAGVVYRISSGVGDSGDGKIGTVKYNRAGGVLPVLGGITSGPKGRLWFTESSGAVGAPEEIGSIGVHGGVTPGIPARPDIPGAITEGPGGNLYFTEPNNETIAKLAPGGAITPVATGIVGLRDLIYADGDLWFTAADAVGRVSVAGAGLQTLPLKVDPDQIVAQPGSASELWFTTPDSVAGSGGHESGAVGTVTVSPSGTLSSSLVTQGITGLATFGITATATQVWFTEGASDRLGVISF